MIETAVLEDRMREQIAKLEKIREEYRAFTRTHEGYIERINGIDIQIEALEYVLAGKDLSDIWKHDLERDRAESE